MKQTAFSTLISGYSLLEVPRWHDNSISFFDIWADGSLGSRRDRAVLGSMPKVRELAEVIPQAKVAPDGGLRGAERALWVADAIGNRARSIPDKIM